MNTHSRVSDARLETLAAHAGACGAKTALIADVLAAATTDAALDLLASDGLLEKTMSSMMGRLEQRLDERAGKALQIEALVFSNAHGILGLTSGAQQLIERHRADAKCASCEHEEGKR